MKIIPSITKMKQNMTNSEKRICDRIQSGPEIIAFASINKVARLCSVSEATLVRFSKKFGYRGFHEFRLELAREISQNNKRIDEKFLTGPFKIEDPIESIAQSYYAIYTEILEHTVNSLKYDEIRHAARIILSSRKVHFCGEGQSVIMAFHAKLNFLSIGIDCDVHTDATVMMMMAETMTDQDTVVAVVPSCTAVETIRFVKKAKENGARVIEITGEKETEIELFADVLIYYKVLEEQREAWSPSVKIIPYFIMDILYTEVARNRLHADKHAGAKAYAYHQ